MGYVPSSSASGTSNLISRDTDGNFITNNFTQGYTATATAAGTTALTINSTQQQFFTGSTTQTVTLPVTSTLSLGLSFAIINVSTGDVTVESSGANTLQVMGTESALRATCISLSGTGTASWSWSYIPHNSFTLPLPVVDGGTGVATLTGVLTGNGTSAVTANAVTEHGVIIGGASNSVSSTIVGTAGDVLTSNGAGVAPTYQTPTTGTVTSVSGTASRITSTGGATPVIDIDGTYVGQTSLTTLGTITTGTWTGTTVAIADGGTAVTSVTTSPTATSFAGWDANSNLSSNNFIEGYATTATAAGTTTLVVGSKELQYFTGATTQTVTMPVTSTLVLGQKFKIVNNSSGVVTVQSSGANSIQAMAASTVLEVTCILTSGTTAASWNATYASNTVSAAGGIETINGNSGSITGTTVTIQTNTGNGTVSFVNATATSDLDFTNANNTLVIGTTFTGTTLRSTCYGVSAGGATTSGADNTCVGYTAGTGITTGDSNTLIGSTAGDSIVASSKNTCVGWAAGASIVSSGGSHVLIGYKAGTLIDGSTGVVAIGENAGSSLTNAGSCVFIGQDSGPSCTGGSNTLVGGRSGFDLTTGGINTLIGGSSGVNLTTGNRNICIGLGSGQAYTSSESNNIVIASAFSGTIGESNALRIGVATGTGSGELNKAFIHGINGVTSSNKQIVTIDSSTSQLGAAATVGVANGGTGVATLTGLALGAGTAAMTGVTYSAPTAWTPELNFGGSSVGITYSVQTGFWTRIGDLIFATGAFTLTSKGSSVGAGRITLPVSQATGATYVVTGTTRMLNMASLTSAVTMVSTTDICSFTQWGAAGTANVDNTNFTDTSVVQFSITYIGD